VRRDALGALAALLLLSAAASAAPSGPVPAPDPAEDDATETTAEEATPEDAATPEAPSPEDAGDTTAAPQAAAAADTAFTYQTITGTLASDKAGRVLVNALQNQHAPRSGFIPMRVSLTNGMRPQKVTLRFTPMGSGRQVTQTVELGPDERRNLLFPVPTCAWGTLDVRAPDGDMPTMRMYFTRDDRFSLLWVGTDAQLGAAVGPPTTTQIPKVSVTTLPARELSGELSAYVGFDAVVLADTRLEDLPQAQARALEAYAATGGLLSVLRTGPGTMARLPLLQASSEVLQSYGFGDVHLCSGFKTPCAREALRDTLRHVPAVRPAEGPDARSSTRYDARYGPSHAVNFLLSQAYPPVGRFMIFIVLFTLVIGPGSLLIARRRGPAMLLFTIPATSLVSCALILGFSVMVDGFATHARTLGVSMLDRKQARTITVGVGGFYANLSPRSLRFGALSSVLLPFGEDKVSASVDWTEGATYGSDLIPSRSYRELGFLSVDPSRARLVFQPGAKKVQNGLGARIRRAMVRTGGRWAEVRDVPDGGEAVAEVLSNEWKWKDGEDGELEEPMRRLALGDVLVREPKEGAFIAVLDGPGPLPLGGMTPRHQASAHIILGEVE